jgi:hypothetical protein
MKNLILFFAFLFTTTLYAHVGDHTPDRGIVYTINGKEVEGHFLMSRDDKVFIELQNGKVISAPLNDFSFRNRESLSEKIAALKKLNREKNKVKESSSINRLSAVLSLFFFTLFLFLIKKIENIGFAKLMFICTSIGGFLYACKTTEAVVTPNPNTQTTIAKTDPAFIEAVYSPFKSNVKTRYDNTYFYIESNGLPTHNMMVGITSWQQQVPIPQDYTGTNSWSIPLNPELATTPLSLKTNFMKGAVAIAPNGIPIFNPLNNRGEDAFIIGELDKWGGHCGRADDYHYHIAPLHFEATAGNNPIAMALDGFPIYGSKEPEGSAMLPLDEYNGHAYKGSYHYHATTKYPYFMGALRGKVTLDPATPAPENQIIPQAKTSAIRPAGDPLKGASITDFKTTGTNAYSLEYTLNNQKGYVNYSWDNAGNFTYTFIGTDGKSTTSKYTRK